MFGVTLADCIGKRGTAKRLPDAPGYWIRRSRERDYVEVIDRDRDRELCYWYPPHRPLMDFDRGEWYGPFRLELVEGD